MTMTTNKVLGIMLGSVSPKIPFDTKSEVVLPKPTPFGMPSGPLHVGTIRGQLVVVLGRHGPGHTIPAHRVNFPANLFFMKACTPLTHLVSFTTTGSMQPEIEPGHVVVPNQFVDLTGRISTFFSDIAVHVPSAELTCEAWRQRVFPLVQKVYGETAAHNGGTHICIRGPHYSTRAESETYRKLYEFIACIGMTGVTEGKLARETEVHFVNIAPITDYCAWHRQAPHTSGEAVAAVALQAHAGKVIEVIQLICADIQSSPLEKDCICEQALDSAVVTDLTLVDPDILQKFKPLLERYLLARHFESNQK